MRVRPTVGGSTNCEISPTVDGRGADGAQRASQGQRGIEATADGPSLSSLSSVQTRGPRGRPPPPPPAGPGAVAAERLATLFSSERERERRDHCRHRAGVRRPCTAIRMADDSRAAATTRRPAGRVDAMAASAFPGVVARAQRRIQVTRCDDTDTSGCSGSVDRSCLALASSPPAWRSSRAAPHRRLRCESARATPVRSVACLLILLAIVLCAVLISAARLPVPGSGGQ